eukprot:391909-Amphidinium_carterae.1
MHPEGKRMHERGEKLALHLKDLWAWMARQESLLAQKEFRDCNCCRRSVRGSPVPAKAIA